MPDVVMVVVVAVRVVVVVSVEELVACARTSVAPATSKLAASTPAPAAILFRAPLVRPDIHNPVIFNRNILFRIRFSISFSIQDITSGLHLPRSRPRIYGEMPIVRQ